MQAQHQLYKFIIKRVLDFLLVSILLFSGLGGSVLADSLPDTTPDSPSDAASLVGKSPWYNKTNNETCTGDSSTTTGSGTGGAPVNIPAGDALDEFLEAIALHESNGNPTAGSPGAASGKYQFEPRTWNGDTAHYYAPALQYSYASAAPEDIQDAVMYLVYLPVYRSTNGNIFDMAVEHYEPAALTNSTVMNSVPPGNTLTPFQYGTIIAQAVSTGILPAIPGKSDTTGPINKIQLYYNNAPDFTTWLAKDGGPLTGSDTSSNQAPSSSTSTPAATATGTAQNCTTGGATTTSTTTCTSSCTGTGVANFVFYSQYDKRWTDNPYGPSGTVGTSGCGPTSVAEVVATLINSSITPADTASWGNAHHSDTGDGSIWQIMLVEGPENWGLSSVDIGLNMNEAVSTIEAGGLVIITGTGAAPFTKDGHILVLRAIASNGDFLVGDPNSPAPPSPDVGNPENEFSAAELLGAGAQVMFAITK
jgi:hypothetical protein